MMEEQVVRRRGWLTRQEFLDVQAPWLVLGAGVLGAALTGWR